MTSTRKLTALTAAAGLVFALTSCSSEPANDSQTITWAIAGGNLANGAHMDPHQSQLNVSSYVQRNVLDSLVFLDAATGEIKPWLAKSWDISADGLEYTFQLRDDVVFHDATKLTAEVVRANFEHVAAKETASAQALDYIGGDLFLGAEVLSEYEVRIKLSEPFKPLLANLSTTFLGIYSQATLQAHSPAELGAGGPGVSIGSGPFILTSYVPNQEIVYTRNKAYNWAPEGYGYGGSAQAERIEVKIVPDETSRVGALKTGEALIVSKISATSLAALESDYNISKVANPGMPYSLYLNWGHGIFSDVNVRKAFSLGFDAKRAIDAAFSGQVEQAFSALTPSLGGAYDSSLEKNTQYNSFEAISLLEKSGWTEIGPDGIRVKDGQRLTVEWLAWQPFSDEKQALVNFMIDDLKKIGMELTFSAIEGPAYQERYFTNGQFILDFDITDWSYTSLDADALRNHLHSDGYQNVNIDRSYSTEIDELLERAAASDNNDDRIKIYKEVQNWNYEQVAIVPIYLSEITVVSNKKLVGLQFDSFGGPLFYGVSVTG